MYNRMYQIIIGAVIGAVVAFTILVIFDQTKFTETPVLAYLLAVVIGAVVAIAWPLAVDKWFKRLT